MPRQSLFTHPKFKRLVRLLRLPAPYVLGCLEFLWNVGYSRCNALVGDADDVEDAAEWPGEAGELCRALLAAGFIDQVEAGRYAIHDLLEHAPDHVKKRAARDAERKHSYSPRQRPLTAEWRKQGEEGAPTAGAPPVRLTTDLGGTRPPKSASCLPNSAPHGPAVVVSELGGHRREERREEREEKNTPPTPLRGSGVGVSAAVAERTRARRTPRPSAEADPAFVSFWEAYPRKEAKPRAAKAFAKLAPAPDLLAVIMAAVERQQRGGCLEPRTTADGRSTVPHPASWLNARRWEDEPPQSAPRGSPATADLVRGAYEFLKGGPTS